jgi:PAS domain S-box-containing protein
MLLDRKGFLDCNTFTLKMFGCESVNEFTKYHPADLSPSNQPDGTSSIQAAITHINRAFDTGTDHFFWVHKRIDGTTFPADVLLTRMKLECRNVLQSTVRDITEQKKAEEQLRENSDRIKEMNEKLRVVGDLTRHDVRNKLSAITGYSYILKKKHADQADIIKDLCMMEKAVKEIEKICDFAKAYEQLGVEKLVYTDAEKTINEAAQMFSGLTFQVINDCHGLALLADSFLKQLFYNLIDNTRKYGEKATTTRVHYEKADPNSLRLIYEDDGVGIPSENKQQLFKQGFSTGDSTGYGLYLIKKMIDVYGWEIEENGEAGKGAKFVMTIPKTNKSGQTNYQIQ